MPFCTQCGIQVTPFDTYCGRCGMRQSPPRAADPNPAASSDLLRNMSARTATMLVYVPWVGWIAAILVLASARFQRHRVVRFNAFQGIYLFVAWLLVDWVMVPFFHIVAGPPSMAIRMISGMLHLSIFATAIFMVVKSAQEQVVRLPLLGELADRSVAEQAL